MPSKKSAAPTDPKPGDPKPKPNSSTLRGKGGKPIMTSVQRPGRAGGPALNVGKPLARSSKPTNVPKPSETRSPQVKGGPGFRGIPKGRGTKSTSSWARGRGGGRGSGND